MQNKRIVPDIPSFDFYTKEAMNILRGNIQMAGYNINVIALTSAKAHEGKSSTSFQLAKSLAGLNKKVVYLDSDIRNSKTKQRYKIMEKTNGLSEYLCGHLSIELITYNRYTIAPRADTIELVILDNYHKVIKILAISRDTITEVERYTMNGNSRGTYDTQIGYAYTYGDGGKVSCTNLVQSVSELLGGIPIQEYVITNNASMPALNTMVGNVSVTVPTDDMVMVFPEFYEGARITLNDENVETFVRWRDIAIPFSNNSRMKRQQAFASGFLQKFKQKISEDPEGVWKEIESMSPYIQTSITKSQYLKFADRINNLTFSEADYYYLVGEDIQGVQYDEVHLDKETLLKTILDLFYIEDGESE